MRYVFIALVCCFVPFAAFSQSNTITVMSATYGDNCLDGLYGNQTPNLQAACGTKQNSCTYLIDVSRIGDPKPGCRKEYNFTYCCDCGVVGTISRARNGFVSSEANGKNAELMCP